MRTLCLLGTASFATALISVSAQAQTAVPEEESREEVTVTGSRIVRNGYDAPTPVSVISSKEIETEAPANIADFVNTLPSVRGSSTAANSNGSLSNGIAGIASVNLRALGSQRTLVLFDGQRSVASATSGVVDVNTFPQALIERVEVVTGGASSAYGSDAVSGVINFILDKKYTGIKGDYEYGITTYGDGQNHKASLTGGFKFGGDKGQILLSGEYFKQTGIHSIDRDWNDAGFSRSTIRPTAQPPVRITMRRRSASPLALSRVVSAPASSPPAALSAPARSVASTSGRSIRQQAGRPPARSLSGRPTANGWWAATIC